jgi:hypothetical protein
MILRAAFAFAFKIKFFGTGLTQTDLAGVGVVIGVLALCLFATKLLNICRIY